MSKRTLYFEGAGCTQVNDVENCRIRTAFRNDDGQLIYLEMWSGYNHFWKTHGKNGRPLKNKKLVSVDGFIICDYCHYITPDKDDCNQSVLPCERKTTHMEYTKQNILDFVNKNCNCSFENVVILPEFSGYHVHDKSAAAYNKYSLMDDFVDIPERTAERQRIYYEVAKEHFNKIYDAHIDRNPRAARLKSKYGSWLIVEMTDKTMTLRNHTYKELIDDSERIVTFDVNY